MLLFGHLGMRGGSRQPVTIAATAWDNMLNIHQLPTRVPVVMNIADAHSMTLTAGGTDYPALES